MLGLGQLGSITVHGHSDQNQIDIIFNVVLVPQPLSFIKAPFNITNTSSSILHTITNVNATPKGTINY